MKANRQLESRMQEICQSGSEGGAKLTFVPTPIQLDQSHADRSLKGIPCFCSKV
jgi:hypothetical protein